MIATLTTATIKADSAQQFINLGAVGIIAAISLYAFYKFFVRIYDAAMLKIEAKDTELRELNRSVREETVPLLRDVLLALKETNEIHRAVVDEQRVERALKDREGGHSNGKSGN